MAKVARCLGKSPYRRGVKPSDTCIEARQPWPFGAVLPSATRLRLVAWLTDEAKRERKATGHGALFVVALSF
jgi:hypothetical protein